MFKGLLSKLSNVAKKAVVNPILIAKHLSKVPGAIAAHLVTSANSMDEEPDSIKELLAQPVCSYPIEVILVFREPVNAFVTAAAKQITSLLGSNLTTDIRHVFMVFEVRAPEGIRYVRFDKNETVVGKQLNEQEVDFLKSKKEFIEVFLPETRTIKSFFMTYQAKTLARTIWMYDPITANCQIFVWLGLLTNGIDDTAVEDWIVQYSVRAEVNDISRKVLKGVTTLANFGKQVIGADGNVEESGSDSGEEDDVPSTKASIASLLNTHAARVTQLEHLIKSSGYQ
jgi:hypothetical protein